MNLKCPLCSKIVSVSERLAGKNAVCPLCKKVFSVPKLNVGATTPAAPPARSLAKPKKPAPASSTSDSPKSRKQKPRPQIRYGTPWSPPLSNRPASTGAPSSNDHLLVPLPGPAGPRLWQQPTLYGLVAVIFGVSAFPLTTVFASETAGLALAGIALLFGFVGLVFFVLFRSGSPSSSFIGLALGAAMMYGLLTDVNRKELAAQAAEAAAMLNEAKKDKNEARAAQRKAEEERRLKEEGPKKILAAAEKAKQAAADKLQKAEAARQQSENDLMEASKALQKAELLKKEAENKEKALETQLDDIQNKMKTLLDLRRQVQKEQMALAEEEKILDLEKSRFKEKLDNVEKKLQETEELKKKIDDALKLLTSKLESPDIPTKIKALEAIAFLKADAPPEAARAVCEATTATDKKLKNKALLALFNIRRTLYVPVKTLVEAVEFNQAGNNIAVYTAAKNLERLGRQATPANPVLMGYLQKFLEVKEPTFADNETASWLIEALGKNGAGESDILAFLDKFSSYKKFEAGKGEDKVRQAARRALFYVGQAEVMHRKDTLPIFLEGFNEVKAEHRKEICEWIGAFGADARSAIPALMKLQAEDNSPEVKAAAQKALMKIQS